MPKPRSNASKKPSPEPPGVEPVSERYPALEERPIVFRLFAPTASQVGVAGTFNDWRSEANPLKRSPSGEWTARVKLKAGRYEYRFVADGAWVDDPTSTKTVPNNHGGFNSVVDVGLDERAEFL